MGEEQINTIKDALRTIMQQIAQRGQPLSDELKTMLAQVMQHAQTRITELRQQSPETAPANELQPQVPAIARELWTLARGDSDIFSLYAQSYPNPQLQALARNPSQLNALIGQINGTQQVPPAGNADGFQHAAPQSSNVYGFRYDPLRQKLTVRFNQGSVYQYQGVPKQIFDMFSHGEGVARTSGSNRWGRWWRGKVPSVGSALHSLIKMGGYNYTRVK